MHVYPADRPLNVDEAYECLDGYGRQYGRLPLLLMLHAACQSVFGQSSLNLLKVISLHEAGADTSIEADVLAVIRSCIRRPADIIILTWRYAGIACSC